MTAARKAGRPRTSPRTRPAETDFSLRAIEDVAVMSFADAAAILTQRGYPCSVNGAMYAEYRALYKIREAFATDYAGD
jgi:hypothetical protein